jgi:hypothetical protein
VPGLQAVDVVADAGAELHVHRLRASSGWADAAAGASRAAADAVAALPAGAHVVSRAW